MSAMMPWDWMGGPALKLMDLLTPASTVQTELDSLLGQYADFRIWIKDDAVYIDPVKPIRSTADREKRFPLSKLRRDQLDALCRIMEKNRQKQS